MATALTVGLVWLFDGTETHKFNCESWDCAITKKIEGKDTPEDGHSKFTVNEITREFNLRGIDLDSDAKLDSMMDLVNQKTQLTMTIYRKIGNAVRFLGAGGGNTVEVVLAAGGFSKVRGEDDHYILNSIRLVQAE